MQTYYAKSILLSSTFWVNVLTMLVMVLEASDVIDVLPPNMLKYVPAVLAVVNIFLRTISKRPVAFIAPYDTKPVAVASLSSQR